MLAVAGMQDRKSLQICDSYWLSVLVVAVIDSGAEYLKN